MKKKSLLRVILFVIIIGTMFLSCSPTGTSKVTIHINLGSLNQHALNIHKDSILDKVFRLFAKNAEAQTVPSNISSLTLNVTAADMEPSISQSYPAPLPSTISVEVPAGSSRNFELIAIVNPSDSSAVVSYRGTAMRDLVAGSTEDVSISMGIYETKIIIPDRNNSRIVQIDNMNGDGWISKNKTDIGFAYSYFYPGDIDFDNQGKIYIGVSGFTTEDGKIVRIDDINTNPCTVLITAGGPTISAMAVDRNNNLIYYVDGSTLYRANIDGTNTQSLSTSPFNTVYSLAVDNQGKVYVGGSMSVISVIGIYDPESGFITSYTTSSIIPQMASATPKHLMVKDPYLYVANYHGSAANTQILQINLGSLTFVAGYGQEVTGEVNTSPGSFYGPHRFLAILNKKIYIADDDEISGPSHAKLVAVDNINGDSWETYGEWANTFSTPPYDGPGYFRLWCSC